ncbi:MAG: DoxX family membrane protein [Thermoflavifilum sp.]|nr:DoxX family membrane protein [Thermoflavifilum sp.]
MKKILLAFTRIIVGLSFLFSGLLKANDPLGLSYKMQEFFVALHVPFLNPFSDALSVILILIETVSGVAILLGYHARLFAVILLLFILLFTFLTGFAWFTGKVQECGCFGDCVPISDAATFWKDVVLLVLIIFLFVERKHIRPLWHNLSGPITWFAGLAVIALQVYVLRHLPIVDCLPYAVGKNIIQEMQSPPGSTPDQYVTELIYEKNGQQKTFTEDNFPWQDTSWHFVKRETRLVKKGNATPLIQDFVLKTLDGKDVTQEVLHDSLPVILFIVNHPDKAHNGWDHAMRALQSFAQHYPLHIYGVTSAAHLKGFIQQHRLQFPFLVGDVTVLKTMARTDPCMILLKQGVVKGKWSYLDIPDTSRFSGLLNE